MRAESPPEDEFLHAAPIPLPERMGRIVVGLLLALTGLALLTEEIALLREGGAWRGLSFLTLLFLTAGPYAFYVGCKRRSASWLVTPGRIEVQQVDLFETRVYAYRPEDVLWFGARSACPRAFSSEADEASRRENATTQEVGAFERSNLIGKRSKRHAPPEWRVTLAARDGRKHDAPGFASREEARRFMEDLQRQLFGSESRQALPEPNGVQYVFEAFRAS